MFIPLTVSNNSTEFHITDDTTIGDPFEFLEPYLDCKGMRLTKKSYPFVALWLLLFLFFAFKRLLRALDFMGLFTEKRDRLKEAIEKDLLKQDPNNEFNKGDKSKRWYDHMTPQMLAFMCSTVFLNRTKASLRLDYEPLVDPDVARSKSIEWYKNHLIL